METKHTGGWNTRALPVTDRFNNSKWPLLCPIGQTGPSRREGRQVSLTVPNMISCVLQGWQHGPWESWMDQHCVSSCAMHSLRVPWGPQELLSRPGSTLSKFFTINNLENLQRTQWNKDCKITSLVIRTSAATEMSSFSSLCLFCLSYPPEFSSSLHSRIINCLKALILLKINTGKTFFFFKLYKFPNHFTMQICTFVSLWRNRVFLWAVSFTCVTLMFWSNYSLTSTDWRSDRSYYHASQTVAFIIQNTTDIKICYIVTKSI